MTSGTAFQDDVFCKGNHCWVCGNENPRGLSIKSYWDGNESVCTWQPKDYHSAGWPHVLNGGIISGIIDCHCVCTMNAEYYKNKDLGEKEFPEYWFATASMNIDFLKPTPVDKPVQLRANIKEMSDKKAVVSCSLYSDGTECACGEVLGVRVPAIAGPGK
jgi:acyl-coenzyme A thioesterase PaaI-like protein